MTHAVCAKRAREKITERVKQKLLRHSNFSCSICGLIPVVFHHIEEWANNYSNNEAVIIPICDVHHRDIHGKRGSTISKKELYDFKLNPEKPNELKRKYKQLECKNNYSFFIGSNFITYGTKATLFNFGGLSLTSIDTSSGVLKLSILSGIKNNKPVYLVKDNELIIDTKDIWKMSYSGPSLKIWKIVKGNKEVFIDLIINSEVIVLKEMNTTFNGQPFRVFKPRSPQKRQIEKIDEWIQVFEKQYTEISTKIDKQPLIAPPFNDFNIDKQIKDLQKMRLKQDYERLLEEVVQKNFKWPWPYMRDLLTTRLKRSAVFKKEINNYHNIPQELTELYRKSEAIKNNHQHLFEKHGLESIIVEYNGIILKNNIMV